MFVRLSILDLLILFRFYLINDYIRGMTLIRTINKEKKALWKFVVFTNKSNATAISFKVTNAYSNLKNKKKMILKSTTFNKKLFNIRQYRYAIIIITLNYKLLNNLFIISETVIETVNALEILHFSRFY